MSTDLLPDPPSEPASADNDQPPPPTTSTSWSARASRRLDALAALLRGTHDHRIPF